MAAAAGGTGLALRRWYRGFDFTASADVQVVATTEDGWQLAMYRYRPRGPVTRPWPVVASHGFAGSHLIYDLGEVSLARYLADAGFDVYALDLRGRGASWPQGTPDPSLQWSFDDFALRDLPAAVERACALSDAGEAFWMGMEMSGQALYAAAVSGTAGRVRGGVTFGSPVVTPPHAKVPGITMAPTQRKGGRVPFRAGARAAGPVLAYTRSKVLEVSFRPANTDPRAVARYFRCGVPDESTVLADQFADWVEHGVMRSLDRSVVWSDHLDDVRLPLLLMAGAADRQRPPEAVEVAAKAFASKDVTFVRAGVADGYSVDFGHDDLLAGRAAPAEVFPVVRRWLEERSEG
jgi:alpha-beta hydrolase superfamily lysophospholipase